MRSLAGRYWQISMTLGTAVLKDLALCALVAAAMHQNASHAKTNGMAQGHRRYSQGEIRYWTSKSRYPLGLELNGEHLVMKREVMLQLTVPLTVRREYRMLAGWERMA